MRPDKVKVLGIDLFFNEKRKKHESDDWCVFASYHPPKAHPKKLLASESSWTVGYYLSDEPIRGYGPTVEEAEKSLIEAMKHHNDMLLRQSEDLKKFLPKEQEQKDMDQDEYERLFPWDKFQVLRTNEYSFFAFGNDPVPKSFFIGGVQFCSDGPSSAPRDSERFRLYKAMEGGITLKLEYPKKAMFRGYMEEFPAVWYASTSENVQCLYLSHKTPMSALKSLHEVLGDRVEEGTQASRRLSFLNKILKKDSK